MPKAGLAVPKQALTVPKTSLGVPKQALTVPKSEEVTVFAVPKCAKRTRNELRDKPRYSNAYDRNQQKDAVEKNR